MNAEMVKSQIILMEGEALDSDNKRNAFVWLQSYIEDLGLRSTNTGAVTVVTELYEPFFPLVRLDVEF